MAHKSHTEALDIMLNHLELGVTKHKQNSQETTKIIMYEIRQALTKFVAMPVNENRSKAQKS